MTDQPLKMNLEKDAEELKLYMFTVTVQGGPIKIELAEDFKAVMAYTDLDAFNMVRKDYPQGIVITIRQRAKLGIHKIIDAVNFQPEVPQPVPVEVASAPASEKTVQDFIYSMTMIADKFVTNKRDQATLKRIIARVNLKSEN